MTSPPSRFSRPLPAATSVAVAEATDALGALLARSDGSAIPDAVAAARAAVGMELTFLSEFRSDRQVLRVVDGAAHAFGLAAGASVPLERGYCARVARGTLPSAVADVRADPLARDHDLTEDADIGAYIGVPVRLADGTLYGSLCGLSRTPATIHDRDVRYLQVLAAIIADELGRNRERDAARRRHAEEIAAALGAESLDMAFQPIVRLADGKLFAFEALARFDGREPHYATDAWFAAAWEIGVGAEFELLALRSALRALDSLPAGAFLCINADPRTVTSEAFVDALSACGPGVRRLIVELTEHSSVTAYEPLQAAMGRLRAAGVRFAADDVGAGYAGLNRMMQLSPEVIKLDRFLIAGVDRDAARQALTASAAAFASATRTRVVAEGIETGEELAALRAAGIRFGQGFHLGRPMALADAAGWG
jgi:EAL domain-containing protein (putative c-di-GMP-specific phosphodiesterase class I)